MFWTGTGTPACTVPLVSAVTAAELAFADPRNGGTFRAVCIQSGKDGGVSGNIDLQGIGPRQSDCHTIPNIKSIEVIDRNIVTDGIGTGISVGTINDLPGS